MSEWRELHADQNLRLAQKMLDQQAEINTLRAELAAAEARGYQRAIEALRDEARHMLPGGHQQMATVYALAADFLTAHAERTN